MRAVYAILAEGEAKAHGCSVDQAHFHEVGTGSALRNAALICLIVDYLHPRTITATPLQVGSGTVECAHGIMDVPTPATAHIIEDHHLPVCEKKLNGELCTPTSAAIIAHFVDEFVE